MALDDSDRNGRLDERDPRGLYVTDRTGGTFAPCCARPCATSRTRRWTRRASWSTRWSRPPARAADEERMRQRAFVYDVASGQLSPYAALDSAAANAGRILGR